MSSPVPDPRVVRRVDVDRQPPAPSDCLPPREAVVREVDLSPGWMAATRRELLTYHPDRDPALVRTALPNVTGLSIRRAGGRAYVEYLPLTALSGVVALALGVGLMLVDPTQYVTVSGAGPTSQLVAIVQAFARGMNLLGAFLVFLGVLAGLGVATILVFWFGSREVRLVVERGDADPVECRTTRHAGTRALEEFADLFETPDSSQRRESTG